MAFFIGSNKVLRSTPTPYLAAMGSHTTIGGIIGTYPTSFTACDGNTVYGGSWGLTDAQYGRFIKNKCVIHSGNNSTSIDADLSIYIDSSCRLVIYNNVS